MYTTEKWKDPATGITWSGTGEVIDRISVYDWEEIVEGYDDFGNEYAASASVSCGIIQDIYEPELTSPIKLEVS